MKKRETRFGFARSEVAPVWAISFLVLTHFSYSQDRLVRQSEPLSPEEERVALSVPEGFRIEIFASEPMINKPINLAVDDRGRVWVSSTVEYPYAATKDRWVDELGSRVRDSRDAIKILEDTNGDGKADGVTDFADGLNIPTGVLPWHRPEHLDGCIAWSIPNIWYLADTTGDGKCDHREVLFGPLGYEKDTHGMCSSFRFKEGWVYATHGFNNTSHIVARDGSELKLHSGNVFRFRPDGSRVEIWSRGQVNPFGLCFDHRGNLYSADCHSSPVYQLLRGAHYPSFGKPHDGLGFGPAMIEHCHGSTGIAGIVYLDRSIWGKVWNDRVLIGNPVNSRVNLDRIEFAGSTPRAVEQPDFVVSEDPWFRPVDLALGQDGTLYIADFYNRIIGHYEVPLDHPGRDRERGRIWRVVPEFKEDALESPEEETSAVSNPLGELADTSPFRRRAAASWLQENPTIEAYGAISTALEEVPDEDTHLRHALRLAMREVLSLPGAFSGIQDVTVKTMDVVLAVNTSEAAEFLVSVDEEHDHPLPIDFSGRRRTLIARHGSEAVLDRLIEDERARLGADQESATQALRDIVEGVEERDDGLRPPALYSWGSELAHDVLQKHQKKGDPEWKIVAHPGYPDSLSPWVLQQRKSREGREVTVFSSLSLGEPRAEQRTGVLRSKAVPAPEILSFLLCGHRGKPGTDAHAKNFVRIVEVETGTELARVFPPRSDVAQRISLNLGNSMGQPIFVEVVDGDAGPSYAWLAVGEFAGVSMPIESFREWAEESRVLRELAELLQVAAPADLRDQLREFLPSPPPAPPRKISKIEQDRLDLLIRNRVEMYNRSRAHPEKGAQIFQAQCQVCHMVKREGGLIGPQLDGIGSRGVKRLAEDILDPNRNVDAHFHIVAITMKDGTATGGFVRAQRGDIIELVDVTGEVRRIPKDEVESCEVSPVSLMPASFGELLSEEEFFDLISWLESQ